MAQEAHVGGRVTILAINAVILAGETEPFKEIPGGTRTTGSVSWGCACSASHVARLANLLGIRIEPGIALVFAPASLKILLLDDNAIPVDRLVTLGAFVLGRTLAL